MPVQEGTAKSAGFIVVNKMPDVCLSPNTPVPYNIIAFLSDAAITSEAQGNEVRFQGFSAFNMKSRVTKCFGDQPGVGLGIGSGAVGGWCRPITPVETVNCNGTKLCRHEHTEFEMNCLGPDGPGNTIGKVIYLGAMLAGDVAPDGAMPSGSNEVLKAETPKEPSFLDKIKDSLKIESIEDAVALADQAYQLSQVDWSNPAAALGALAGMAERAGLKDLSKAFGLGQKAVKADWSKPSSILKHAAELGAGALELGSSLKKSIASESKDSPYKTKADKLDADGEKTFASPAEAARNKAAIQAAVNDSPTGVAIVGGDHAGGPSIFSPPWKQGYDHVMVAYKENGEIKIAEMMPSGESGIGRNFGSPNAPSRSLDDASRGYDLVHAVPVTGLSSQQSSDFVENMKRNTAPGNVYSFNDSDIGGKKGEQCASSIGTSLTQAGVPNRITSNGDLNLVRPDNVLDEAERINRQKR